ncbi:MAG: divalent-cation tolerance protein CutA [Alphaproteobacteria bacterium]|nr:divalent-cation tolerance protein CutA [Alphaproteobacteria bacterium]
MSAVFIYVTVPSEAEAGKIAAALVEQRLVACANAIPGMKSIYRWQGRIARRDEAVLILKTQTHLFPAVETAVRALHPDETPCIVALPVENGNAAYLKWIETETT